MRQIWTEIERPLPVRVSVIFVVCLLAVDPIARGLDYIAGDGPDVTRSLSAVEAAAPLWFWGTLCLILAAVALLGAVIERYEPIILAGTLGFALYATFAAGLAAAVVDRGWPPDGFRTPVMFLVIAAFWATVGIEMFASRNVQVEIQEGVRGDPGGTAG